MGLKNSETIYALVLEKNSNDECKKIQWASVKKYSIDVKKYTAYEKNAADQRKFCT